MMVLFDVMPSQVSGGMLGIAGGAAFLLAFLAAAYIAFKMLKRSVKMAFRLAIVAVILMIAVAGSVALWALGTAKPSRPVPQSSR
jgi:uncharacterized membrane protein